MTSELGLGVGLGSAGGSSKGGNFWLYAINIDPARASMIWRGNEFMIVTSMPAALNPPPTIAPRIHAIPSSKRVWSKVMVVLLVAKKRR